RVLSRSGAAPEPFWMLGDPRVVGGTLNGEVERDLHAVAATGLDQPAKIVERAELGMDGVVPAFRGSDRVGAAGIARLGAQRIVDALAIDAADRMDRREIDDVEAQLGELRQSRDAVIERSMAARDRGLAARKHLVPGAGAC